MIESEMILHLVAFTIRIQKFFKKKSYLYFQSIINY